jgi:hypothetical protein
VDHYCNHNYYLDNPDDEIDERIHYRFAAAVAAAANMVDVNSDRSVVAAVWNHSVHLDQQFYRKLLRFRRQILPQHVLPMDGS